MRRARLLVGLLAIVGAVVPANAAAAQPRSYKVTDVRTVVDRAAVAGSGAAIVEVDHGSVVVTATRGTVRALRRLGYRVRPAKVRAVALPRNQRKAHAANF